MPAAMAENTDCNTAKTFGMAAVILSTTSAMGVLTLCERSIAPCCTVSINVLHLPDNV